MCARLNQHLTLEGPQKMSRSLKKEKEKEKKNPEMRHANYISALFRSLDRGMPGDNAGQSKRQGIT